MPQDSPDNWDVGFDRAPTVAFQDTDNFTVTNFRNFRYQCDGSHTACWESRTFDLQSTSHVDFLVVPFAKRRGLAHTMVSFGFDDGQYFSISVEARRRTGQPYSVVKGVFGAYPLTYLIADERDVIGHRTEVRGDSVHLYRSAATRQEAACFLKSMLLRTNALSQTPETYNTISNNCLTNLRDHVNEVWPGRIPWRWQVLLSGHADHLAYKLNLLEGDESFQELSKLAIIDDLAHGHWHHDDFSQRIRVRLSEYCLASAVRH